MTRNRAADTLTPAVLTLRRDADRSPSGGVREALWLSLAPGGLHVIFGEAGSGKTGLVEMIAMARPPARGVLELFGEDAASVRPSRRYRLRRRIGMIFQDLRLIDEMTATDNLALAVRAIGRRVSDAAADIAETLAWVGLRRNVQTLAGALPPEGRRRLALARAVINRPDLVIADGAVGEGDEIVERLLGHLCAAGAAVLVTTRNRDFARRSRASVTWMPPPPSWSESEAVAWAP